MEFLGDAILSSVVSESLFLQSPDQDEGDLSLKRDAIISRSNLNKIAKRNFKNVSFHYKTKYISENMFGNFLEAIIGAIYLDKGIHQTRDFIKKHIYKSEFLQQLKDIDYKSKLLALSQKEKIQITYRLERQKGPDHNKEFLVAILVQDKKVAEAKGNSKKEAEQNAAKKAIKIVF